jgi:RNA polymerase sigma factor (sigma-70 family)
VSSTRSSATMHALSDAALVERCRAGDDNAWQELVERFSRYVYAIVIQGFRLARHDAEDVFQDVFLRVYDRLGTLRDDEALRPWIGQMTRRVCLDRLSAGKREELVEEADLPALDETLEELESSMDVHEALSSLDEPCRELLDRFFARDQSYRVIGDALGVPMGTVASRISRCLARLREHFEGSNQPARPSRGTRNG